MPEPVALSPEQKPVPLLYRFCHVLSRGRTPPASDVQMVGVHVCRPEDAKTAR
jgi:hypothetical protein